jgi:mono/diheme cytochrome c family protein
MMHRLGLPVAVALALVLMASCGKGKTDAPDPSLAANASAGLEASPGAGSPASPDKPPLTEAQTIQIAEGRAIAVQNCAGCHALDADTQSPRADAPPMRDLLARYDSEALADDLIAGIKLGHEDMPQFDFSVIAADALVAYLRSIRGIGVACQRLVETPTRAFQLCLAPPQPRSAAMLT